MFFKTLDHHIIHSSNIIDAYVWHQKCAKITKNAIFTENSNFEKMFLSVQNHHICSKMRTWDVLKVFPINIRYPNTFLRDFEKIDFFRFFLNFSLWDQNKFSKKYRFSCKNTKKSVKSCSLCSRPFPKNFIHVRSVIFGRNRIFNFQTTFSRNWPFLHIYRFRPLKALKSEKFLHQQILHVLSNIFTIYDFVISPIEKKISPFEVPKLVIYWVLDDRITWTFYTGFTQGIVIKFNFRGKEAIFLLRRKSSILTLLGAKQPYQVASFHLS